jgi:Dyp-type peroxidase family
MVTLEKHDIQGNILESYGLPEAMHLFAAIENAEGVKKFLQGLEVTPAILPSRPDSAVNVAFSYQGLEKLRASADVKDAFSAFADGMPKRAKDLGDVAVMDSWWDDHAHLWVAVHARDEATLMTRVNLITSNARKYGLKFEEFRAGAIVKDGGWFEHFGFRDNISNPSVEGHDTPPPGPGTGKQDASGQWVPINAGEFLFGYENEAGEPLRTGELAALLKNGTFAVIRKLEQNVPAFRKYIKDTADELKLESDLLAARMVGRKKDGTPLMDSPNGSGPTSNDFGYQSDPHGSKCPLGSHIRRTNPRDATGVTKVIAGHRLIRRGMPYGPELPEGAADDENERGLLFIAFNTNIERQFEFVQTQWVNGSSGSALDDDQDPIAGERTGNDGRMVIEGDHEENRLPKLLMDLPAFVTCQGGQYFFMPGLAGLRLLYEGGAPAASSPPPRSS